MVVLIAKVVGKTSYTEALSLLWVMPGTHTPPADWRPIPHTAPVGSFLL